MIELVNLTKIYHTDSEGSIGLKNISIKFPERGFVCLTGQSGSGKTTLLSVLSGFQPYEEGDMFIDGVDALSYTDEDWQKYQKNDIGFIFQDYGLIESYKVIDNVIVTLTILGLNKNDAKNRAIKYLKLVHLEDVMYQKANSLSSGQKQRLSIARAIAKEPKIILCDEPTANLDPDNSLEVMQILGEISKERLVITSTHNYEDAKDVADYFVRLYKGNLVSFDKIKGYSNEIVEVKENGKPSPFDLFITYFKNRKIRFFTSIFFRVILVSLLFILLSMFLYNIDDANTKILSQDIFNNINKTELLMMKSNKEEISDSEFDKISKISHVTGYDKMGLASDINYYYRDEIDYKTEVKTKYIQKPDEIIEYNEYVLNKFNKSLYTKSSNGHIKTSDLKEGTMPQGFYDVVASSEYKLGDEIKVYFDDYTSLGVHEFNFTFKVCGVLNNKSDDLYFSESFLRQLDFIQYASSKVTFYFHYDYYDLDLRKNISANYSFIPLLDESLNKNEMIIAKDYYDSFLGRFPKSYNQTFIFNNDYEISEIVSFGKDVKTSENISGKFIFVSKDIYDNYMSKYLVSYSRIYVDEYPYLNDVIDDVSNLGYDVISPYRASSNKYDSKKVSSRNVTLIISIIAIIMVALVYYAFSIIYDNMKKREERVFLNQGASSSILFKLTAIENTLSVAFGLILGISLYLVIRLFNEYLFEAFKYLRFYHYLIIIAIIIVLTLLSLLASKSKINKISRRAK